jgi:asparaginyl-tRNA synthetase
MMYNEQMAKTVRSLPKPIEDLSDKEIERKKQIGMITTHVLNYFTREFTGDGFEWLLPVVFSKTTDPLWPDPGASIEKRVEVEIYDETVRTTLSMIVHKITACSLVYPKLFTLSPNVRIEKRERAVTGVHAYEFTQLDFEVRNASSREIRGWVEKLICGLIYELKKEEHMSLGRCSSLEVPEAPFKIYDMAEIDSEEGWERSFDEPVWIVNMAREFYDFEDFETGKWDNYDLFLPGYGEVLSGSKREWEYEKILKKMERDGVQKENYGVLLKLAKDQRLKQTAGAGIGVERLISWLVGAKHVGEVQPFPKIPGMVYEL